jgi:hypothetical protein
MEKNSGLSFSTLIAEIESNEKRPMEEFNIYELEKFFYELEERYIKIKRMDHIQKTIFSVEYEKKYSPSSVPSKQMSFF